ncbi:hypothetical protein P692DRAFT_20723925, partial [Suillus brevipes Sb2]
ILEYELNIEQAHIFSLIANHLLTPNNKPLRMFLGGPGGTGKLCIITAVTEFFKQQGEDRCF